MSFDSKKSGSFTARKTNTQTVRKKENHVNRRSSIPDSYDRKQYQQLEYSPEMKRYDVPAEEKDDQYILTGRNPIREALRNHHDLEKLLVQ